MMMVSEVFLIPFIIYLTFHWGEKKKKRRYFYGLLSLEMQNFTKLKGFWWYRWNRTDPTDLVEKNYLPLFTSSDHQHAATAAEGIQEHNMLWKFVKDSKQSWKLAGIWGAINQGNLTEQLKMLDGWISNSHQGLSMRNLETSDEVSFKYFWSVFKCLTGCTEPLVWCSWTNSIIGSHHPSHPNWERLVNSCGQGRDSSH